MLQIQELFRDFTQCWEKPIQRRKEDREIMMNEKEAHSKRTVTGTKI